MAQSHDDVKTVDPRFDPVYQRGYDSANPKPVAAPKSSREPMNESAAAHPERVSDVQLVARTATANPDLNSPLDETAYLAETAELNSGSDRSASSARSSRLRSFRDPLLVGLWIGGAALAVVSFLLYLWSGRLQWSSNYSFQTESDGTVSTGNAGGLDSVIGLQFLQAVTPALFLIGIVTIVATTLITAYRRSAR